MKSKLKNDSFHVIKTISGEISLDFSSPNISKKLNKLIKLKNNKRKNRRKIIIKEEKNIIKKREQKIESIKSTKIRKEFIPLPLINNDEEDTNNKKEEFLSSKLNQINNITNSSISYINENEIENENNESSGNIEYKINSIKDKDIKINKIENKNIIFIKNNFICKKHPNNKYTAYCSICQSNICQKCLINSLNHVGHRIFFFKDIMPSEIQIKYYQTVFLCSKYYLDRIRDIIIEIYNDLSEFYETVKNNVDRSLIENIQRQLKKSYKKFYTINLYQLIYAKKIISLFIYYKEYQHMNYQVIQNLNDLKINSVKIPDLFDQHIIIKAKTMIEFMIYKSNYILKACDSSYPSTIYSYKNCDNNKKAIENSINFNKYKSFNDLFVKNPGVIYEPSFQLNNNFISNISKSKSEDQNNKKDNNIINTNNNRINIKLNMNNLKDKEENLKEIFSLIKNNINNEDSNINININNNEKEDDKSSSNTTLNFEASNINEKSNEVSFSEKTTEDTLNKINNNNIIIEKDKEESLNNIPKTLLNNFDTEIKKYITTNLPTPSSDEVEYKKNIQYLYYDKLLQKKVNCIYHGEFKKNTLIRHGRGLFIWEDGEFYLGYWQNDKREGKGTNNYSNGDIYEGEYKNGKKEGKGTYKWKNGDIYIGDWKNDMKDGEGKYKFNNGDKYIGLFKMDKIEGNGIYVWANENTYKGQFKNNEIKGKGILNYICTNVNKEIKDMHNKINFQKNKDIQGINEKNNKSNDDKKFIEIFTCDRINTNKNNLKNENNDINNNYK